jgi:methionine-rich copper-binding protein CopC
MNIEIAPTSANLVAYYNFNRGISAGDNTLITYLPDMTSNNYHGQLISFNLTEGNNTSNFVADCDFDFEAPETPTLADLIGECSVTAPAPTTTDNCAGTITGTTTDPTEYTTQGTYTITWTFTDNNGHSVTAQQNVIVDDNTAPVTPTLADLTGECSVTATVPTTTDNCAGTVTGTTTDPTEYTTQGTYTINWTFADGNGNTSTQTQNVIIEDVTAPVANETTLTDITAECEVTTLTAPTATDNCAGTVTGTHNATLPITATTIITWIFADGNGNTSTQTQNIVIDDITNPTITCVANQTVDADATHTYTVQDTEFDPTATDDNCGIASIVNDFNSTSTLAGEQLPEGTTTIVWTVTDNAGNTTTCSFNVLVNEYVGIADLSANGILIYPNPTSGIINLTGFNEPVSVKNLEITDITGKTIQSSSNFQINQFSNYEIDLSGFDSGIYIVKISTDKEIFTSKLIKK